MGRGKTTWFVAVLWVLLLLVAEMGVEKCRGWAEEAAADVKDNISEISENANLDEKAEAVKKGASEAYSDAKDTAGTWSSWAYDKISKGFGSKEEELKETGHSVADQAGDAATKTTETISTATSGASEKAGEAVKAASDVASNLKSESENAMGAAAEKAKETFVAGKEKAAEAYEAAKECVDCEAAKEKVSQTAGEFGAKIREKTSEL